MNEEIAKQVAAGKMAEYDENGNFIRWIPPEEYKEMSKDFDEEYMCPKSIADWKRSMGIPPLFSKKISQQQ